MALHDQRAGVDARQLVATGRHAGGVAGARGRRQFVRPRHPLADRHGFAREQRFVGPHAIGRHQQGIGRHAITLAELEQVAAHHVAPGDALRLAVADDQRARAGEVAQRFDGALGLALLVQRERHGDDHEAEQRQALLQVAEDEVERARREQQQEHRLAHRLGRDRQQRAVLPAGQRIGAVLGQALGGLGCAQARIGVSRLRGHLSLGCSHVRAGSSATSLRTSLRARKGQLGAPANCRRWVVCGGRCALDPPQLPAASPGGD